MLQHGSYTLLIDACYDREQFPTRDEAIDWTWASSEAEIEAVDFVLSKFFTLENGVYVQARIRDELAEYQQKAATNKRIADERETKRKENSTNRAPVVNASPPNHKPITNNQEPLTSTPKAPKGAANGFEEFWAAYPRKDAKPLAIKAFAKVTVPVGVLLAAIARQRSSEGWTKDGGKYIPMPASWLNAERWNDGVVAVVQHDEESRDQIERLGVGKGLGAWDVMTEQWPTYKARVLKAPHIKGFDLSQLGRMAAQKQGIPA